MTSEELGLILHEYILSHSWKDLSQVLKQELTCHIEWDLTFCELHAALILFEQNL